MRTGQTEYRNDVQGTLFWVRTREDTGGQYSLLYAEAPPAPTLSADRARSSLRGVDLGRLSPLPEGVTCRPLSR
ncbi:hypothetical protein GCM10011374_32510 [Kocuria dechangensis]|uniref:Uncharacterized protein n=1 Tax=Kocuria dechangensis TaxID=1176249 RepID=A0A917LZJ3_9MICC|nr:hypothetical protein GCM10011374_32510 [Kocuria dechangensis]